MHATSKNPVESLHVCLQAAVRLGKLQELLLSGCGGITLSAVRGFPALTFLDLSHCEALLPASAVGHSLLVMMWHVLDLSSCVMCWTCHDLSCARLVMMCHVLDLSYNCFHAQHVVCRNVGFASLQVLV